MVFYNGTEDTPDHAVMRLSDAFEDSGNAAKGESKQPTLELVADVYNINAGHNSVLLEACDTLKGYAEFVSRVRGNQQTMPLEAAVNKAVAIWKMGASFCFAHAKQKLVSIRVSGCG